MLQTIPTLSIIGMIFSLVISIGLPIAALIFWRIKTKANVSVFFIGAACMVVFAFFLEAIVNNIVAKTTGTIFTNNIWLYALYGAFAAALFEEGGRFITMHIFMGNKQTKANGIMFGLGHGGIEAIVLVGFTMIANLITSFMINSGTMEKTLQVLGEDLLNETVAGLSPLWETASYMFFIGGIERISAMMLQIAMAFLVYRAYSEKKYAFLSYAFGIHFAADFITVIVNNYMGSIIVEIVLLAISSLLIYYTYTSYKKVDTDTLV